VKQPKPAERYAGAERRYEREDDLQDEFGSILVSG
jgi:hypothetical protein